MSRDTLEEIKFDLPNSLSATVHHLSGKAFEAAAFEFASAVESIRLAKNLTPDEHRLSADELAAVEDLRRGASRNGANPFMLG